MTLDRRSLAYAIPVESGPRVALALVVRVALWYAAVAAVRRRRAGHTSAGGPA